MKQNDKLTNLTVIANDSEDALVHLLDANVYYGDDLVELPPNGLDLLDLLARLKQKPEEVYLEPWLETWLDERKEEARALIASLDDEAARLMQSARFNLVILLNAVEGNELAYESHLRLIEYVKQLRGEVSLISTQFLAERPAMLLKAVPPRNRYFRNDTEVRLGLTNFVTDPNIIYQERGLKMEEMIREAQARRSQEIRDLGSILTGDASSPYAEAIKTMLTSIPSAIPRPQDEYRAYEISVTGGNASLLGIAQVTASPIQTVSELTQVPINRIPYTISLALGAKTAPLYTN